MFDVSVHVRNGKIIGEFLVDSYFFEPAKYIYAFYLYKDNQKVDILWYTNSTMATFDLNGMTGLFYIKVFVRDIEYENTRTYDSAEILIPE